MCGDVLGAAVEGWEPQRLAVAFPQGLSRFQQTDRGFGCYTDDSQMAIALARCLVDSGGRCYAVAAARAYATEFELHRGYGGTAYKVLQELRREGADPERVATIGSKHIPGGSFGNGGAMRIAPLGLVYRHAPPSVVREAVAEALRCTHVHPTAVDGALVVALAVGYLSTRQPGPGPVAVPAPSDLEAAGGLGGNAAQGSGQGQGGEGVATAAGLLEHLLAHAELLQTPGMRAKLETLRQALSSATTLKAASQPWSAYLPSPGWAAEMALHNALAEPFQIRADDAAAVALQALCCHWACPEDAIVAAVHFGGDTDTIAAITGAMAGALHGTRWLPQAWVSNLENGKAGRDEVLQLAAKLAELDTTTA
ncbi:hypothetical protein HYH03_001869 [Edaphochlamys debaryana]|uniref:ADP-ribosylhydrolase ARH3 n=1 Tax=Edaphochlamys debaryana TaxID=47281 RepID=A0A836C4L5_9CHLO|nr:hypothetical protein HYH03_001869 [Edaphochlamys debaryana]|eukprot:KAG2500291.1 hypothetical protein HYH03_001869 [Edaphochlamys debaryana]